MQKVVGEDEKEKLIREHEENMKNFENNLKKQQERTKEMLREKLAKRKRLSTQMKSTPLEAKVAEEKEKNKFVEHQTSVSPILEAKKIMATEGKGNICW